MGDGPSLGPSLSTLYLRPLGRLMTSSSLPATAESTIALSDEHCGTFCLKPILVGLWIVRCCFHHSSCGPCQIPVEMAGSRSTLLSALGLTVNMYGFSIINLIRPFLSDTDGPLTPAQDATLTASSLYGCVLGMVRTRRPVTQAAAVTQAAVGHFRLARRCLRSPVPLCADSAAHLWRVSWMCTSSAVHGP